MINWKLNRNHSYVLTISGQIAWQTAMNLLEEYKGKMKRVCDPFISLPMGIVKGKTNGIEGSYHRHDDVIKYKHFPRYWPFVRGIHRSPVNSPHKGQWRGALVISMICARTSDWVNNRNADIWDGIVPIMTSRWWSDPHDRLKFIDPTQNGRHFTDDILDIFSNWKLLNIDRKYTKICS